MAKTTKQARLAKASSRSAAAAPAVRPKFSPGMALVWLDGLDEQFNGIASVAISGRAYQETRADGCEDPVMLSLLRVIQQQADESTNVSNELRKMLETLPAEVSHG